VERACRLVVPTGKAQTWPQAEGCVPQKARAKRLLFSGDKCSQAADE